MREDGGTQAPSNSDDRVLPMLFGFLIQELANSLREVSKGLALGERFIHEGKVVSLAYVEVHASVLWTVVDLTKAFVDDDWDGRVAEQDLARFFPTSHWTYMQPRKSHSSRSSRSPEEPNPGSGS